MSAHERRTSLIASLRDRRLEVHKLRRERVSAIAKALRDRVEIGVQFKGQKDDYRTRLGKILKGSGVTGDAQDKLVAPEAADGPGLGEAVRSGTSKVRELFGLSSATADKLIAWLTAENGARLAEVEAVVPGDSINIRLQVDDVYRDLRDLSAGQRATAFLLLLFAHRGRILVLDQPEDDLDNRFVYDDIVQILRHQKGATGAASRQVIAATHNANIPVLGDAELVVVLEPQGSTAHVSGLASIDDPEVCEKVKLIMEGGEEAFRRRAEKYGQSE